MATNRQPRVGAGVVDAVLNRVCCLALVLPHSKEVIGVAITHVAVSSFDGGDTIKASADPGRSRVGGPADRVGP